MFHQGANLRALIGRSRQTSETTIPHCLSDTHGYGDESTSTTTGSPREMREQRKPDLWGATVIQL